jgi:predicted metal-dependent HD superfamily phosphohydrolase
VTEPEACPLAGRWPLAGAAVLRDSLLAAYAEDRRGYHDRRHLAEVLDRLDELAAAGADAAGSRTVRLAAWFHDAVYDGEAGDEERSATWAERALPGAGVPAEEVAEVARLVRMTQHHRPGPDDAAGAALSDADLAVLSSSPARYREYVAGVRAEYAHVPDDAFAAGRAAVLRDLMAAPTLFRTDAARRRWEHAARANLARELADLDRRAGRPG